MSRRVCLSTRRLSARSGGVGIPVVFQQLFAAVVALRREGLRRQSGFFAGHIDGVRVAAADLFVRIEMPSMPEVFQVLRVQNPLGSLHQRGGIGFVDALAHHVARWAEAALDVTVFPRPIFQCPPAEVSQPVAPRRPLDRYAG